MRGKIFETSGTKNCLVFLAILIVQKYFKTHFFKVGFLKKLKKCATLRFKKKGGKILHIVLNNSSKFNLTFRRVEKKQKKIPKKEINSQKGKKKFWKSCAACDFFLWEDRL